MNGADGAQPVQPAKRTGLAHDDLWRRSRALEAKIVDRLLAIEQGAGPDPTFALFGEGLQQVTSRLWRLERASQRLVQNLQRNVLFDPLRRDRELNQRMWSRKIGGHMITAPNGEMSLLAACHPDTWVAPAVHLAGLAIDERMALFTGPASSRGLATAWLCTDPDIVGEFCGIWEDTQRHAVPIYELPDITRPSERQVDIAALLSRGVKDATIARLLGVSPRTVTSDVSRLLDVFGVSTRWEAGMVIGASSLPQVHRTDLPPLTSHR